MIFWPIALPIFPFSPILGAILLSMFAALGVGRILALVSSHWQIAAIFLSQFIFHALCILVSSINALPLYIPVVFAASNGLALLLALADKRPLERRGRVVFLFLAFFLVAVVWDFITRYPTSGSTAFLTYFRYGLELSGRDIGPNVFAYSLVLTIVVVFNFTHYRIAFKRIVATACLLGLMMVSARMPILLAAIFLTFLCEDRGTRRYWIPFAIVVVAALIWSEPDFIASGRFASLLEGSDTSNSTRLRIYSEFLLLFDRPIFGGGLGAYFRDYGLTFHNDFMEILYATGGVGVILYYGGQIGTYLVIIGKKGLIDRRLLSLFLVQFGFTLTESLSISTSSFTGICLSYLLYSFAIDCIRSKGSKSEIDVPPLHCHVNEVSDMGPESTQFTAYASASRT